MWFKILTNYINGYIKIEIEGYYIERFINTCMKKGIFLWSITRKKGSIIQAKVAVADFKEAVSIAREHSCLITIKNKKGVPFLIKKYKKRKVFFILLLVLIVMIIALSRFIWNIEVVSEDEVSNILQDLDEAGIKIGKLKSKINTKDIINEYKTLKNL